MPDILPAIEGAAKAVRHVAGYVADAIAERRNAFSDDEHGDYLRCAGADALAEAFASRSTGVPQCIEHDLPSSQCARMPHSEGDEWNDQDSAADSPAAVAAPGPESQESGGGSEELDAFPRVPSEPHPSRVAVAIRDVLSDHAFWPANHSSIGLNGHCGCGDRPHGLMAWREHVAPLIAECVEPVLALPDTCRTGEPWVDPFTYENAKPKHRKNRR